MPNVKNTLRPQAPHLGLGKDVGPMPSLIVGQAPASFEGPPSCGHINGLHGSYTDLATLYANPLPPGEEPHAVSTTAKPVNTCGCGDLSASPAVGPFINFTGYNPTSDCWTGSVLYIVKPSVSAQPLLSWRVRGSVTPAVVVAAQCLDVFCEWNFWKFVVVVPMAVEEQVVEYWVDDGAADPCSFYVAGREQPWHWAYYSCNGFTPDVPREEADNKWKGITPLWKDLVDRHAASPMHALVGGGDQLYNDDVLTCPELQQFFDAEEAHRVGMKFSPEMQFQVEEYYFHHYAVHFAFSYIGQAMRSIPSVMTWDDHDIFDGWGSYPPALQESGVFQGIFAAAKRFYLLFQLHTTPELASYHGFFGRNSYSQVLLLGPRLAVALPDCRAQRTETQVLAMDTHLRLMSKVEEMPDTVRHLVLGTTVPLVYPHLKGGEAILTALGRMNKNPFMHKVFQATGIAKAVFNDVDEPELLDDLRDHWSAPTHSEERRFLIEHMQMLAKAKHMRISIISGDVHLAATGRLYSYPKPHDLRKDFRFMPQIVCSAIGNAPPPDGLVTVLHVMGHAGFTNRKTRNKMCRLFDDAGKHRMLNRRNWCEIFEVPSDGAIGGGHTGDPGALVFTLRVEQFTKLPSDGQITEYQTVVPVLDRPAKHTSTPKDFYANRGWSKKYREEEGSHDGREKSRIHVGRRVIEVGVGGPQGSAGSPGKAAAGEAAAGSGMKA